MLAAFVLGVPEHVRTTHWMKLDADTKPVAGKWVWPDYAGQSVVSHRWRYTKMKRDPNTSEHWLNTLDRLFAGRRPMLQRQLDPKADARVWHRRGNADGLKMRFASFAHIESTDFTRRISRAVRRHCGGRLPIPSQDTLSWYLATLWREPVKLINMKEWFAP
jgi:hypothetical protein